MHAGSLLCILAASTLALHAGHAAASPAPHAEHRTAERSPLLGTLLGEWEGTVQTRDARGRSSSSVAHMTVVSVNDTRAEGCFEGSAFGDELLGAFVADIDQKDARVSWSDSRSDRALSAKGDADKSLAKLSGASPEGNERIEMTIRVRSENEIELEWHARPEKGEARLLMRMSLVRMEKGQVSAAADNFADSRQLAASRADRALADAADSGR